MTGKSAYLIDIKFKNGQEINLKLESDASNLGENIAQEWQRNKTLIIADYVISSEDILFIKIEGEK